MVTGCCETPLMRITHSPLHLTEIPDQILSGASMFAKQRNGRITQTRLNFLYIERKPTALNTSCPESQGSWLLAPRTRSPELGAQLCHGCEIPSSQRTFPR